MNTARIFLAILTLLPFAAGAAEFEGSSTIPRVYRIDSTRAVNDFSEPIDRCSNMEFELDQASRAEITIYGVTPDADTLSEIQASTVLAKLDGDERYSLSNAFTQVRFVVDAAESGERVSTVTVTCRPGSPVQEVFGIDGSAGSDETVNQLYSIKRMRAISEQVTTTIWFDPILGSDATGNGSYEAPFFSFYKLKTTCLMVPHSRCVVKGRDRIFTHTLLEVDYTGGTRALQAGETVTFTTPAGTAKVLAVHGSRVAVSWLTGSDPRAPGATTFSAGGGDSAGSVTRVLDSINGLPSRVFAAGDITVGTEVIASAGHSYATGDGPFLWYSAAGNQTFTANAITENVTQVYVCTVVANTSFQLATDAACANIVNWNSAGTGNMQLIAGLNLNGLRDSIDISCRDNTRVCSIMTSEFEDAPWMIDSGALAGDGAFYAEVNVHRWPNGSIGAGAGTYNTPVGGIFLVDPADNDPANNGWVAIENGSIRNMGDDCLAAGRGGKLLAVNVDCIGIRNGASDRSQNGATPWYQAHNSVATAYGDAGSTSSAADSALVWIGGEGSSNMGSDSSSGGFLNPNQSGSIRVISDGSFDFAAISGATTCSGGPCTSPMVVMPGGDAVFVGPHFRFNGLTTKARWINYTGSHQRIQLAKTIIESIGTASGATSSTDEEFFSIAGGAAGTVKQLIGYNVTIAATGGPQGFIDLCPLLGPTAGSATSRLEFRLENALLGWETSVDSDFRANVGNCGVGGYTEADAVARTIFRVRGVWDRQDDAAAAVCTDGPRFCYGANCRCPGVCGDGNSWINDICTSTDTAGNATPDDAWEWFTVSSGDSNSTSEGDSWLPTDPSRRCVSSDECNGLTYVSAPSYAIDLTNYFDGSDVSCIPADVLGARICSLKMTAVNAGAR